MIDPNNVTNYDRSDRELEEFLLFCIVSAGKTASVQAQALGRFLRGEKPCADLSPFNKIRFWIDKNPLWLDILLKNSRLGMHNRNIRCFTELVNANLDLRRCSTQQLENIYGIGPKTARFFVLHTRQDQQIACLDTHILKFLREHLGLSAPKTTPASGPTYKRLEDAFVSFCGKAGISTADADIQIWRHYANGDSLSAQLSSYN